MIKLTLGYAVASALIVAGVYMQEGAGVAVTMSGVAVFMYVFIVALFGYID